MIGYPTLPKIAGNGGVRAQYRAQDALIKVCAREGVTLTLFHGRGAPSAAAVHRHTRTALTAAGKPERRPATDRAG